MLAPSRVAQKPAVSSHCHALSRKLGSSSFRARAVPVRRGLSLPRQACNAALHGGDKTRQRRWTRAPSVGHAVPNLRPLHGAEASQSLKVRSKSCLACPLRQPVPFVAADEGAPPLRVGAARLRPICPLAFRAVARGQAFRDPGDRAERRPGDPFRSGRAGVNATCRRAVPGALGDTWQDHCSSRQQRSYRRLTAGPTCRRRRGESNNGEDSRCSRQPPLWTEWWGPQGREGHGRVQEGHVEVLVRHEGAEAQAGRCDRAE
jgi:hypothetical protein